MWHIWAVDCLFSVFSVFWFRKAGYSGLQAGFSGYLDRSLRTYTRSLWVQLTDTHFIEWITCHMHHTYSWHSLVHPTVNLIRAFVFLSINMPIVDMSSQNWNSKFMAYIKGELLYARCLSFYVNQMSYMWVVINHQKGGDWKWSRPLGAFWWIMTKHMYI